eukprot:scaffold8803_cov88-Skeletonema_marinoi.AAC.1
MPDKLARFRMSLKAHKVPWKMRAIVCCAGTLMNCLSTEQMQMAQLPSPASQKRGELLKELKELGRLPSTARLFTADANKNDLAGFPLEAVKDEMKLVMRNNIFEWEERRQTWHERGRPVQSEVFLVVGIRRWNMLSG